ncbi:MAG: DUF393 domain-containing protein [Phycisphaerales bacterium]|nr:DUF393 domain-containing protein [Phycisphaerales bacterium]
MKEKPYIIFFDGHCRFCRASAMTVRRLLGAQRALLVDSTRMDLMQEYPRVNPMAARQRMYVLTPGEELCGGYDGVVLLVGAFAVGRMVVGLMRRPGVSRVGHAVYGWVARHRGCAGGACSIR